MDFDEALSTGMRRRVELGPDGAGGFAAVSFGETRRPVDTLFLHANGFNALTYRSILEPLGATQHVLAVDQRGHGRTMLAGDPDGRRNWHDLASDIVALLERLDGPPVTLAGHSMGGTASILAAGLMRARVRRLVLFDPVIFPWPLSALLRLGFPARGIKQLRYLAEGAERRKSLFPSRDAAFAAYRGRGAFRTWQDAQLADYVADGFRDRPDGTVELACAPAWEASSYLSHAHDVLGALKQIDLPVRIFRAEQHSTCSVRTPLSASMIVQTVPGTTHFLPMERPDLVREALARP